MERTRPPGEAAAGMTRRELIVTSLAVGFASAALPLSAQTLIATDAAGLTAGEVKIPSGGSSFPAYRALPDGGTKRPVVVVVEEIFGVHEHIKDVCRRLAKLGYLAVAPELFARQGDVSRLSDIREIVEKVVSKVPDSQVLSDLDATVAWAAASGEGNVDAVAITGFCWGGRVVWLYAAHSPKLKAGVAWYGRLSGPSSELQPKHPLDVAAALQAPVLGLYGGQDQGIPVEQVERMRSALKAAGKPSEIIVYPEAPHGFFADYRPSYSAKAAEDGWRRLQEWLRKNGVG